jgi:hypothetical protein
LLEQILRLGTHAEAEFLLKLPNTFDCLLLNANLVESTPSASAALVFTLGKPYAIDPFSHAFGLPHRYLNSKSKDKTAELRPKRSFAKLADKYFGAHDFVGKQALEPDDIDVPALASATLHYQRTWFQDAADGADFILNSPIMNPRIWWLHTLFWGAISVGLKRISHCWSIDRDRSGCLRCRPLYRGLSRARGMTSLIGISGRE